MIRQGDVFRVELGPASVPARGCGIPYVVIQNDVFNASRIETVVVCSLTSKLKRAQAPGNVLLEQGEANLPKPSVVNVSAPYPRQVRAGGTIGSLGGYRVQEILGGVYLLLEPRDVE